VTTRSVVVVSGGLSVPSSSRLLADRLATATRSALASRGEDVVVETVELREHAHAVTDHLLTGFPPASLKPVLDAVRGADGLVLVTPIFSASFSGLFKSFLDVLEPGSLDGTPTLIGATGGTARHSLALEYAVRPVLAYARARVAPTAVFAASSDWGEASVDTGLAARIERAATELADLIVGAPGTRPRDPFEDVTPFERLLSGDA
jgi:FMN reductase